MSISPCNKISISCTLKTSWPYFKRVQFKERMWSRAICLWRCTNARTHSRAHSFMHTPHTQTYNLKWRQKLWQQQCCMNSPNVFLALKLSFSSSGVRNNLIRLKKHVEKTCWKNCTAYLQGWYCASRVWLLMLLSSQKGRPWRDPLVGAAYRQLTACQSM